MPICIVDIRWQNDALTLIFNFCMSRDLYNKNIMVYIEQDSIIYLKIVYIIDLIT